MIGSFYLYFVTLHFPRHLESLLSGPSCLVVVVCVVCVSQLIVITCPLFL